jgi:hypothetical protein
MGKKVSAIGFWRLSELASLLDNVDQLKLPKSRHPSMARTSLNMQRRQAAKGQLIRWKRDLRHLAARKVSTAL